MRVSSAPNKQIFENWGQTRSKCSRWHRKLQMAWSCFVRKTYSFLPPRLLASSRPCLASLSSHETYRPSLQSCWSNGWNGSRKKGGQEFVSRIFRDCRYHFKKIQGRNTECSVFSPSTFFFYQRHLRQNVIWCPSPVLCGPLSPLGFDENLDIANTKFQGALDILGVWSRKGKLNVNVSGCGVFSLAWPLLELDRSLANV